MRALLPSLLLTLVLLLVNIFFGSISLPMTDIFQALCSPSEVDAVARFVVYESRLPSALTAVLAGASLSVAGLVMQTIFANPLADPSILGVNAGAGLGAAVAMLLLGGTLSVGGVGLSGFLLTVCSAFVGAMAVILLLLLCSARLRSNLLLLIAGMMVSFVVGALISLLSYFSTSQGVHSFVIWGLGDFSGVPLSRMPLFATLLLLSMAGIALCAKPLNALLLGNDYATNLGMPIRLVRTWLLLLTGLLTAIVTAACGPISFLGLAVPHVARLTLRTSNHRVLVPVTMLWGSAIALLCLFITRLPADGTLLPLGAITPLMGVPVVLYILFCRRSIL